MNWLGLFLSREKAHSRIHMCSSPFLSLSLLYRPFRTTLDRQAASGTLSADVIRAVNEDFSRVQNLLQRLWDPNPLTRANMTQVGCCTLGPVLVKLTLYGSWASVLKVKLHPFFRYVFFFPFLRLAGVN